MHNKVAFFYDRWSRQHRKQQRILCSYNIHSWLFFYFEFVSFYAKETNTQQNLKKWQSIRRKNKNKIGIEKRRCLNFNKFTSCVTLLHPPTTHTTATFQKISIKSRLVECMRHSRQMLQIPHHLFAAVNCELK